MEKLDNNFILVNSESSCPESNSAPATLGLTNMAGRSSFRVNFFFIF